MSRPGAVLELEVGDDDVRAELGVQARAPPRPSSRPPTTSMSARRRRPRSGRRGSGRGRRRAARVVGSPSVMRSPCRRRTRSSVRAVRARGDRRTVDDRAVRRRVARVGSSAPTRRARSCMISRPWESWRAGPQTRRRRRGPRSRRVGGVRRGSGPRSWTPGVPDGVGHRLLGDPQQLGLDLGAQPGGALVERDVDRDPGAVAEVAGDARRWRCRGCRWRRPRCAGSGRSAAPRRPRVVIRSRSCRSCAACCGGGRLRGERRRRGSRGRRCPGRRRRASRGPAGDARRWWRRRGRR